MLDQINQDRGKNCTTCVNVLHPDSMEIKEAMEVASVKKTVEATLMGENRITPSGLVAFDCEKFLVDNISAIRKQVAVCSGFVLDALKK